MRYIHRITVLGALAMLALTPSGGWADSYQATFLVSNVPGMAEITDPLLQNPWGVSFSSSSPFWISNAGSSTSTLYSGDVNGNPLTKAGLEVSIPGGPPTGQVNNSTGDFGGAIFIFAGINGTLSAWSGGTQAALVATVDGASYRGLALGTDSTGANLLYAANVRGGTVDVFDANFQLVDNGGAFTDPDLDPDFTPFNVVNFGGVLMVTYKSISDPDEGGAINMFDTDGNFLGRFTDGGTLNAPWGLALAPDTFGEFSGALLVGGFGDGRISAFDPNTGDFLGLLKDSEGNPWVFERLWALIFGNGGSGGDPNTLYFTAGINAQQDGLFGSLLPAN